MTKNEIETMNLTWWQKEDLLDLLEKYPEVEDFVKINEF